MKFPDEILMAYVDGELDPATRAAVEAAMASDPALARAVERQRALGARLRAAYDDVVQEPVPDRLAALLAAPVAAPVVQLDARRPARRFTLPAWAAMAASLVAGVFVGMLVLRVPAAPFAELDGALVARGALATALDRQLAAEAASGAVRVGLSFRGRTGAYCRTFSLERDSALAGLACHEAGEWRLKVLSEAQVAAGELRAAAAMPPAVLRAVDAEIDGEPLDATAEAAARAAGWR